MISQHVKIYRVNRDYYKFNGCKDTYSVIEVILNILTGSAKDKISLGDLPTVQEGPVEYYLYVHNHRKKESDWFAYFPSELRGDWDFNSQNISIILFAQNGVDVFLIIGGAAFQKVVKVIDHSFGLRVLSKVIKPEEDRILSIQARGLTDS